jgi:hypothetical protein
VSGAYVPETLGFVSSVYITSGDKKWLETHLWHAKRMRMENMWGYRLVGTHCRGPFR